MRFHAYLTEQDEAPLLDFVRSSGGRLIRIYSPDWPPVPLDDPPRACGEDECLALWFPEIITQQELLLPDCRPEKGPHDCHDAWELPLITFQRQWYWKRQPAIFAVELDYRAFRPNRPEDAEFSPDEIVDFEQRLVQLFRRAEAIRNWCAANLRHVSRDCFAGEDAWNQSEEIRRIAENFRAKRNA